MGTLKTCPTMLEDPDMPAARWSILLSSLCSLCLCGESFAQLPQPRLDRVFPLGGEAGSAVTLDITGANLDDARSLLFDHPGLKAKLVKPNQFRVTIAADVPVGTHEVRAVGKYGISGSRLFAVCRGLTEVARKEGNNSPDKAQAVSLEAAVNGTATANADDYYRFTARKGQRLTIDCHAFRLDSTLQAVLTVSTADGRALARSKPYHDRTDPLLDFVVPADGTYLLSIHDLTFNGDLPYRLTISTRPHLELAWPPAVVPGKATKLTLLGRNLPDGLAIPDAEVNGRPLERLRWAFTPPASAGLGFTDHVASQVLNGRAFQCRPDKVADALDPVTLVSSDDPVTLEQEPNDRPAAAQALTLPAVVCGRFDRPGDVDWYRFTAKAGEVIAVDMLCERIGRPGDPVVILRNENGKDVATLDDFGTNNDALTQASSDPAGTFNIPANGTYHLLVQERFHRGGPRYTYVLRVGKPWPDFYPVVFHELANSPFCPTVRQGGSTLYEFCLNRRDGFDGTATVEAEGLPRGVTCRPVHVGPNTELASVVFTAASDARDWAGAVRLKAWVMVGSKRVERPVACVQRRWNENTQPAACRACRLTCLAVRQKAPYGLDVPAGRLTVAQGRTVETKVRLARLWPAFKDKVQVTAWKPPAGFDVAAVDIDAGKTEAVVKLTVSGDVPPGTYSIVLRGDAQVPFNPDPKATDKPNVRVADPAPPLTVRVTPAKK
jgi:hypothetical protein